MKKRLIIVCTITSLFLLVSSTAAIPNIYCSSVMKIVNNVENNRFLIDNNIGKLVEKYEKHLLDIALLGNISKLIDFLIRFLDLVIRLSKFIANIFNITYWIYSIISQLNNIISTIIDIIEFIQGLFNPKGFSIH